MGKLDETRKKGTNTLIALTVIAVAVYAGFTPLFNLINGGVAGAVVGASFGAIFVIILTIFWPIMSTGSFLKNWNMIFISFLIGLTMALCEFSSTKKSEFKNTNFIL